MDASLRLAQKEVARRSGFAARGLVWSVLSAGIKIIEEGGEAFAQQWDITAGPSSYRVQKIFNTFKLCLRVLSFWALKTGFHTGMMVYKTCAYNLMTMSYIYTGVR